MGLKFNIDRPKITDEEIRKQQDFDKLVRQFKEQSIKKARGDESWWKNKKIQYSAVIAGITVICTVTYFSLYNNQKQEKTTAKHDKINTLSTSTKKHTKTAAPFVKPPVTRLAQPYASYKVKAERGATITHKGASKIVVPKNSFVDKNGKDVIGDVTIEYREFHDLADVISNGIPMAYDSAGKHYNLETAGMFDVRGTQHGEPVFIKPGSPLQVALASSNSEDRFNQYYLDTVSRNWKYLKRDNISRPSKPVSQAASKDPAPNAKISRLEHEIEKVIPARIDSVRTATTRRIERLPDPAAPSKPAKATPGRPSFVLDGNYKDFPELTAFSKVVFEVGPENRNYSPELHQITWSDIKVNQGPVKGRNYLLTLIYRDRTEKLVVYPVLSGADYEEAREQFESRLEQYQDLLAKRTAEEKRLVAEMERKQAAYLEEQNRKREELAREKARIMASYDAMAGKQLAAEFNSISNQSRTVRMFEVSRFGIFNSDCPHPRPELKSMSPVFMLSENQRKVQPAIAYMIDHGKKTVYAFNAEQLKRVPFDPAGEYSFCLFRNDELYMCSKADFEATVKGGTAVFPVKRLDDPADINVFRKALEI